MPSTALESRRAKAPLKLAAPGSAETLVGPAGDEAAQQLGMTRLPRGLLYEMSRLGVEIRAAGIIHTDLGFAFATRKALHSCVQQLEGKIQKARGQKLHEIASSLAKCAKGISLLSGRSIGTLEMPALNGVARKSFAAGQNAQFHQHLHVHHEAKPNSNPAHEPR